MEDSVHAADCDLVGYAGDGEWVFRSPEAKMLMEREYSFLLLSAEEQEGIIEELAQYVELDCDDVRGPLLGAMYAIGVRTDSPEPDWNRKASEVLAAHEARRKAEHAEYVRKCFDEDLGFPYTMSEDQDVALVDVDGRKYRVHYLCAKDFRRWVGKAHAVAEKIRAVKEGELCLLKYVPKGEKRWKTVVLSSDGMLSVPRNLMGRMIGAKGARIKKLSALLGCRIKLVETPDEPEKWWVLDLAFLEPPEMPNGVEPVSS